MKGTDLKNKKKQVDLIDNIKLDIPEDIGRDFLKKMMGGRLVPQMEEILEEKRGVCINEIEPKAIFEKFEIDRVDGDSVYFKSGNIFEGPNISKILTGSEAAVIFLFTLGGKIDKIIKEESNSGDTMGTIIMDTITTSLLGTLGEHVGNVIKDNYAKYEDWSATCT